MLNQINKLSPFLITVVPSIFAKAYSLRYMTLYRSLNGMQYLVITMCRVIYIMNQSDKDVSLCFGFQIGSNHFTTADVTSALRAYISTSNTSLSRLDLMVSQTNKLMLFLHLNPILSVRSSPIQPNRILLYTSSV